MLQALLAHLLAACGDGKSARLDADELAARFSIPREELQDHLSLLNLVNFGGGCYTVYAEVDEDTGTVRVDKELYGDVFRRSPKLTPLEARAIRLAIEYVGPTIAADATHAARSRAAEARGDVRAASSSADAVAARRGRRGDARPHPVDRGRQAAPRRDRVPQGGRRTPSTRLVEPYSFERELPVWRVHTWDRTVDGPRTYRLDRMRSARLTDERFEAREGFDPNYLAELRAARVWHSPAIARWKVERGARALTDKAAVSELPFKTEEWLLSEVLADRGETVVLEPVACARWLQSARASSSPSSVSAGRVAGARQSEPERGAPAGRSNRARADHRAPRRSRGRPRGRDRSIPRR